MATYKLTRQQVNNLIRHRSLGIGNLNESSYKRIKRHIDKIDSDSWAIFTAFRGTNTLKQNKELNTQLGNDLRGLGYGFIKIDGYWSECQDENIEYDQCPDDQKKLVKEASYLIPNITKENTLKLLKKYQQDAGLFSDINYKNGDIFILTKSGQMTDIGTTITEKDIEQIFSKWKNRKFKII